MKTPVYGIFPSLASARCTVETIIHGSFILHKNKKTPPAQRCGALFVPILQRLTNSPRNGTFAGSRRQRTAPSARNGKTISIIFHFVHIIHVMKLDPHTLLNAVSDATRLRIVHLLKRRGELCVCELVKTLESPQPKISKHLGILRNNGIIVGRRESQWIHYRINPELPAWADSTLDDLVLGCASRSPYRDDLTKISKGGPLSDCA